MMSLQNVESGSRTGVIFLEWHAAVRHVRLREACAGCREMAREKNRWGARTLRVWARDSSETAARQLPSCGGGVCIARVQGARLEEHQPSWRALAHVLRA